MFKERLKQCRIRHGDSQQQIATYLNITRQAYNHYETGNRVPSQETLLALADYFNVSVDYLLCRTDNPERRDLFDMNYDEILALKEKGQYTGKSAIFAYGGTYDYIEMTEEEFQKIKKILAVMRGTDEL